MHSKSDKITIMIYDKADEVIEELFKSFFNRYQIMLETLMKGSEFIFDRFNLLHYQCHEINMNYGESYINYLDWIKKKKCKNKFHQL